MFFSKRNAPKTEKPAQKFYKKKRTALFKVPFVIIKIKFAALNLPLTTVARNIPLKQISQFEFKTNNVINFEFYKIKSILPIKDGAFYCRASSTLS